MAFACAFSERRRAPGSRTPPRRTSGSGRANRGPGDPGSKRRRVAWTTSTCLLGAPRQSWTPWAWCRRRRCASTALRSGGRRAMSHVREPGRPPSPSRDYEAHGDEHLACTEEERVRLPLAGLPSLESSRAEAARLSLVRGPFRGLAVRPRIPTAHHDRDDTHRTTAAGRRRAVLGRAPGL